VCFFQMSSKDDSTTGFSDLLLFCNFSKLSNFFCSDALQTEDPLSKNIGFSNQFRSVGVLFCLEEGRMRDFKGVHAAGGGGWFQPPF